MREAFDGRLAEIVVLGRREGEELDRAFAIIDEMRAKWLVRDHDGWLDRSTRSHRAMILADHGRWREAIEDLRAVELRTVPGSDDYALNKHAIAITLRRAGRPREAIAEIESALRLRDKLHVEVTSGLLVTYAEAAKDAGLDVPSDYTDEAKRSFQAWGVAVDEGLVSNALRDAILLAEQLLMDAQRRYNYLRRSARGKPDSVAAKMAMQFIETEPVGRYRALASEFLDSLTHGSERQGH